MASEKRKVVIAIDQSHFSEFAFDFYVKYVMQPKDDIVMVHVSEYNHLISAPTLLQDPVVVTHLIQEENEKVKQLVDQYSAKMKKIHMSGKVKQLAGKSGEAIIATAKDEKAELIVMGTRGMGKVRRTFLGSVSDYVLHHAHVPVLICRHPPEKEQKEGEVQEKS